MRGRKEKVEGEMESDNEAEGETEGRQWRRGDEGCAALQPQSAAAPPLFVCCGTQLPFVTVPRGGGGRRWGL